MPAATGTRSHCVCAKILEFVFGRSIATNSPEEVAIVFRTRCWNTQVSRTNPAGNSPDIRHIEAHRMDESGNRISLGLHNSTLSLLPKTDTCFTDKTK